MTHRAGFVNIVGKPNVGKSTLMNKLVGENLSIITSKAQTTRHRIQGIVNGDEFQIVYSDTPGILDPAYKLQESMMGFVNMALEDADIFLVVVETGEKSLHPGIEKHIRSKNIPVILLLNKIDLHDQAGVATDIQRWQQAYPDADVVPIAALHGFNLEKVMNLIIEKLPESPPYYPKDELTDKSMRFFVAEIIREKILQLYKKEIPYSVEVVVESYKEGSERVDIRASVFVVRESQRMIIIGNKGRAIKLLGTEARKDIEKFIGQHIYLDLTVKVRKDWRNNPDDLRRFGYEV